MQNTWYAKTRYANSVCKILGMQNTGYANFGHCARVIIQGGSRMQVIIQGGQILYLLFFSKILYLFLNQTAAQTADFTMDFTADFR